MFKEFKQYKYEENVVYDANINLNGNLERICCSDLLGCNLVTTWQVVKRLQWPYQTIFILYLVTTC